ncbi:MAG TPA: MBOAT family protein [Lachnospiraceae bacterium]|nr:MBOAT family protein [Lachnospiraceae bacterium]
MFVSYGFIAFIIGLVIVYYIIPKKLQWGLLLFASFGFYYFAGASYLIYITVTATTVYLAAMYIGLQDKRYAEFVSSGKIDRAQKKKIKAEFNRRKKLVMLSCLILNLGILAVTKYTSFVIANINRFLDEGNAVHVPDLIIPLGISFYTFQAVSYLLDVYWGKCEVQRSYPKFLLFVTFFPQLIQGPISRYKDLSQTLYTPHKFVGVEVGYGLQRVLWGYFKKLVIADRLMPAVRELFDGAKHYTGGYVFIMMIFWAIVLYADFTGGIDITIGIARMLGIRVEENFVRPFFSKDITEYWRRWHITMGTWFRDYVFYPCSISKPMRRLTSFGKAHFGMGAAKRIAVYLSTLICWLATGIWHGAAWHFVAWGLTNGVILLITSELAPLYGRFRRKHPVLVASWGYKLFMVGRTFLLMCCIRLFDVYNSAKLAIRQFVRMFTDLFSNPVKGSELMSFGLTGTDYIIVAVGVVLMITVSMCGRSKPVGERLKSTPYAVRFSVSLLLFLATVMFGKYGAGLDASQFIYNAF